MSNDIPATIFNTEDVVRFRVQGAGKVMADLAQFTLGRTASSGLFSYEGAEEGTRVFEFYVAKSKSEEFLAWFKERGVTQKPDL